MDGIQFSLYQSIDEVQQVWDETTLPDILSQSPYLRTIELDSPDELSNLYVVLYDRAGEPMGTILLQSLLVKMSDSFNYERYASSSSAISRLLVRLRQIVIEWFNFRTLVVGNLYLTGHYGFHFIAGDYTVGKQSQIVDEVVRLLAKRLCHTSSRFSAVIYKDYFDSQQFKGAKRLKLHPFRIDPNMILRLDPSWESFDDYLGAMRSKYRIRMKNGMNRFRGVERRVLDLEGVREHYERMHTLYENILEGSGFVLAKGEKEYFLKLKEQLGDRLHVVGYFLDGEMIGFYNWVIDLGKLDAHFIGMNPALNLRHQIYLNILLDLVRDAINNRADYVYYYRTALEIKSSIGAEPHEMTLYARHNNRLINLFTSIAFSYFIPHQHWTQRHPFKRILSDA